MVLLKVQRDMKAIFPEKLKRGDAVRVVAPSDSLSLIPEEVRGVAVGRFSDLGLDVSFGQHVYEVNEFDSSSIESRVSDLHDAFADTNIRGVFAAIGGYNSNQLLRYLDWKLIKKNPKVFVGYSDTTALQNAIYAKTGLVTYSGPAYTTFGQKRYFDYTLEYFKRCTFEEGAFNISPSELWTDESWYRNQDNRRAMKNNGWFVLNEGRARGTILGANICTFNLLQGTEYFPDIRNSILFVEDDAESKLGNFDRDMQSLIHLPHFDKVQGIVIGRFQKASEVKMEQLKKAIMAKEELRRIPVLANVDFGHTDPMITFPIGGTAELIVAGERTSLTIIEH